MPENIRHFCFLSICVTCRDARPLSQWRNFDRYQASLFIPVRNIKMAIKVLRVTEEAWLGPLLMDFLLGNIAPDIAFPALLKHSLVGRNPAHLSVTVPLKSFAYSQVTETGWGGYCIQSQAGDHPSVLPNKHVHAKFHTWNQDHAGSFQATCLFASLNQRF